MQLNWRDLITLAWLVLIAYTLASFGFTFVQINFTKTAGENFSLFLIRTELLGLVRAFLLEFLLMGFYALSVYRLMLLGEPLSAPKFSDVWLRRYVSFLSATLRAMALPALAFLPYALFILFQILWDYTGVPPFIPDVVVLKSWPTQALKFLCALVFYMAFARAVFVQPATAVDVVYSPRESWRVTDWIWGHMLVITSLTLGSAMALIVTLQLMWPVPATIAGFVALVFGISLACALWMLGVTGFVVALSIAFCLRTGWRPGAQKLSLKRRPFRSAKAK